VNQKISARRTPMPKGARFMAVIHFASRLNENRQGLEARGRATGGCLLPLPFTGGFVFI